MKRITLALLALGWATAMVGCCCGGCGGGYGAGYAPSQCSPCGPAVGSTYGPAPVLGAPGGCPNGNCGVYPSGAYYGPTTPTTASTGMYYQTAAAMPMDPLPTF